MSTVNPESIWRADLVFKALSATIFPIFLWMLSLNSENAVIKERSNQHAEQIQTLERTIKALEQDFKTATNDIRNDLKSTTKLSTESATRLSSIENSLAEIARGISETRADIRILNQRLMSYPYGGGATPLVPFAD